MIDKSPRGGFFERYVDTLPPKESGSHLTVRSGTTPGRFLPTAETLSPYPDGVCLRAHQEHIPNPGLMDTARSIESLMPFEVKGCKASSALPNIQLSEVAVEYGFRQPVAASDDRCLADCCINDSGYWTLCFATESGAKLGELKVPAPCEEEGANFDDVMGIIHDKAALLKFQVLYVTYLDKDFDSFALLTPQTVQFHADCFHVIVEVKKDETGQMADVPLELAAPSEALAVEGTKTLLKVDGVVKRTGGYGTVLSSPNALASLLFRAPQVKGHVPAPEEELRLDEAVCRDLSVEEEISRGKISSDEATTRLILRATESTAMYRMSRYSLSNCKQTQVEELPQSTDQASLQMSSERVEPAQNNGNCSDEPSSSVQLSLIERMNLFSLHVDSPMKVEPDKCVPRVTRLRLTSPDEEWSDLIQKDFGRLTGAVVLDLCSSLGIPREAITTSFSAPNSLLVIITRLSYDTRTSRQFQSALWEHGFPNLMQLYDLIPQHR
ncbi:uncharacterized protein TEOVI_000042500 [Trypanosoma equiperdum]|uniref:Uncharacterized protein n=2 Tax=Trypanozoon TaxID=39700 RepID=Q38FM9_TRYB2|nr:hypothetical protein, conserved [Trypanosoma brucei brucei TREU927]EAN76391.1 hypothetical protein, conserved [Trypanosoma brucei brucei TREU927]SCU67307.1 hypothetical protein, conserved [Trypanosoma equiperdum]